MLWSCVRLWARGLSSPRFNSHPYLTKPKVLGQIPTSVLGWTQRSCGSYRGDVSALPVLYICIKQGLQQNTVPVYPKALVQGELKESGALVNAAHEISSSEPILHCVRLHMSFSITFRALYWSLICD